MINRAQAKSAMPSPFPLPAPEVARPPSMRSERTMRNSESACPSQSQVSAVASSRGAGSPYALFRHRGESMLLEVQLEDCLVSRSGNPTRPYCRAALREQCLQTAICVGVLLAVKARRPGTQCCEVVIRVGDSQVRCGAGQSGSWTFAG